MFIENGVAYSIYVLFYKEPVGRIKVTAYIDYHYCEIVDFYVYKIISHKGIGTYLHQMVENQMVENQMKKICIERIEVVPIPIVDKHLPKITDAELKVAYQHLGFNKINDAEKRIAKPI